MGLKTAKVLSIASVALTVMGLSACSNGTSQPEGASASPTPTKNAPVTLKVVTYAQENFDELITDSVKKKFPYITFEPMLPSAPTELANYLSQQVAAGNIPDLLSVASGAIDNLLDAHLAGDLTPLIQQNKFNLNVFEPRAIDSARAFSENGKDLVIMPISRTSAALYYNKDIFDKFGVAYPKDGMTWDDAYELAKKLTRSDGNNTYNGFDMNRATYYNNQLSLQMTDPATKKATVNTDGWREYFNNFRRFYEIPGNKAFVGLAEDGFIKDKNIAMLYSQNLYTKNDLQQSGIHWDLVTLPVFKQLPKTGMQLAFGGVAIPPTSKNRDAAFQVLAYLVSDEQQVERATGGNLPILASEKAKTAFLQGNPYLKDKNMKALFALDIAKPIVRSANDRYVRGQLGSAFIQMMTMKQTVVDALTKAQQAADQAIQSNAGK